MKMDATVPPTDHSLPQLSICALVALLCRLFSAHCLPADVAFSNDNQRIYAVSGTDNETKPALREINLSTNTVHVIPLRGLADHEEVFGVASGDGGKILFISVKNLWAFDPRASRVTKLCSAPPSGKPFNEIAYDPKSHAAYVTIQGENDKLFMVKNGRELVPVTVRRHDQISCLVFNSEGELFYEESGDLWRGKIESDTVKYAGEIEEKEIFSVTAERYAPIAYLETSAGMSSEMSVGNLAVARDGIYVELLGRHLGALLKLPPPIRRAETETYSSVGESMVKRLSHIGQILQGVKSLGDVPGVKSGPAKWVTIGASADGSRVYYKNDDGEYLVTNGRTQKLQLRESDQKPDTGASTSVDANSAEATAEPPSPPTISSDAIAAVAEREIDAISTQNIDTLVSFYADKVDLLDKGMVSKDTVRNNLQQYFDRWPITKWKIAGRVDVKPLSASRYQLAFPVAFEVANPATNRRIVGTANETRTVVIDSAGTAKIVSQREKIIRSRTVGR
jgi:hypothetical protein